MQSCGCQGKGTPSQTFGPPNNCLALTEPQQIQKHKRDFIFPLFPNLELFCSSQHPSRSGDWGLSWHHDTFN